MFSAKRPTPSVSSLNSELFSHIFRASLKLCNHYYNCFQLRDQHRQSPLLNSELISHIFRTSLKLCNHYYNCFHLRDQHRQSHFWTQNSLALFSEHHSNSNHYYNCFHPRNKPRQSLLLNSELTSKGFIQLRDPVRTSVLWHFC